MARLDAFALLPNGGLTVVWGRRRIGKTRLLLNWSKKHNGIYYTADESSPVVQRKYFSLVLEKVLPGFASVDYPDWMTFFTRLAREALHANWRGPLVIDELPYLVLVSPEFPSILQRFIDIEAKEAELIVALCGSSQQMMLESVIKASAPLYGRADEIIKLGPISIGYMDEALQFSSTKEIVESYSIWGEFHAIGNL